MIAFLFHFFLARRQRLTFSSEFMLLSSCVIWKVYCWLSKRGSVFFVSGLTLRQSHWTFAGQCFVEGSIFRVLQYRTAVEYLLVNQVWCRVCPFTQQSFFCLGLKALWEWEGARFKQESTLKTVWHLWAKWKLKKVSKEKFKVQLDQRKDIGQENRLA